MSDDVEIPADLIEAFRHARNQIATWQEIADQSRCQIEALMGEASTATVDGQTVVRWTHVKSNRLDQTLLKALHPAAYSECQTTTTSRRFTAVDGAS